MGYVNTAAFYTRSQAQGAQEQPLELDGLVLGAELPATGGVVQYQIRDGLPRRRVEILALDPEFEELCGLYGWGSSISHAVSKATSTAKKVVAKAPKVVAKAPAAVTKAVTTAATNAVAKAAAVAPKVAATVGKAVVSGAQVVGTQAVKLGQKAISAAPTVLPAIATGGLSLVAQQGLPMVMGAGQQPQGSAGGTVYQDADGNVISKAQYDALMQQYKDAQNATTYLDADGNVITEAEYNAQMAALNAPPAQQTWPSALDAQAAAANPGSTFSQGAVGQSSPMGYGYGQPSYGDTVSTDPYGDPYGDPFADGSSSADAGIDDAMSAGAGMDAGSDDADYGTMNEDDTEDAYSDLNSPDVITDDEEADWYSGDESAPDGGSDEFGVGSWFSNAVDRVRNVVAKGAPIAGAAIGTVIAPGAGTAVGASAGDLVGQALTKKESGGATPAATPAKAVVDASAMQAPPKDHTLPWVIGGSAAGLAVLGLVLFIATRRPAPAPAAKTNPRRRR